LGDCPSPNKRRKAPCDAFRFALRYRRGTSSVLAYTAPSFANRFPERILVHSPSPPFDGNGLTLPSPPARTTCSEPVSRNGLSLAQNDCPSMDHHSEVNTPGLLLRNLAEPFSSPYDLLLHCLPRFRPATGGFIAQTRCLNHCPTRPVSPRTSAPRWGFCFPSGS